MLQNPWKMSVKNTKEELDLRVANNEESKWIEQVQDYVNWKPFK